MNPVFWMADGGGVTAATEIYPSGHPDRRRILLTDRFWRYNRETRVLAFPDGRVAEFATSTSPFRVRDPFGNVILTITHVGTTMTVTQSLVNGLSRIVVLTLPSSCGLGHASCVPTSMVYRVDPEVPSTWRTWSYTTTAPLAEAQPPIGPKWTFASASPSPGLHTMTMTTPHGGQVVYTYHTISFPWGPGETIDSDVLRFRQGTDVRGGQSGGVWEYQYEWASPAHSKTTHVLAPDGTTTTVGSDYFTPVAPPGVYGGRGYKLVSRVLRRGTDPPLETETREYEQVAIPGGGSFPELTTRTITRQDRTYTTDITYSP